MALSVKNVSKSYRDAERNLTVIQDLTFDFPEKGTIGILGRSGIGKSTLLHLLGGLDTPTTGTVSYGSTVISSMSVDQRASFRAQNVGFIFQFHHLLPEFTATENVAMPLIMSGLGKLEAAEKAQAMLTSLGLKERVKHLPGQLSGGEQQRVAIARALVGEPRFVLADEPTGNLDVATAQGVQEVLTEINKRFNSLFIIVTHNRELASSLDYLVEMEPGGKLRSL